MAIVTVYQIKKYNIKNDDYDVFPGKFSVESIDKMTALFKDGKPVRVDGSEEQVEESELDERGWYDPSKKG